VAGPRTYELRPAFGGLGGRPPNDIVVLVAVEFVVFTCRFFAVTSIVPALLELSPAVWRAGFVWQLATYPFAGYGPPSFWFLLELLILYWFGKDVFAQLGRRLFWRTVAWGAVPAGIVAVLVEWAGSFAREGFAFNLIEGQRIVLVILIAAFATINRRATIYLVILPIQARWFLGIEVLFGFMGFLATHDFAGFLGICTAVGVTYAYLSLGGGRRGMLREARLRIERWWIERRLARMRSRRGIRVVRGGGGEAGDGVNGEIKRGPWSH
jgi:hypothetical protein